MLDKYIRTLCEALDCKEQYEHTEQIEDWTVTSDFGYHYGSGVMFKKDDILIGWSQYDNCLFYEKGDTLHDENSIEKNYELTKQPELVPNMEEIKNMLPTILADGNIENFPVSQFLETIQKVCDDIVINYPIYWDKNHEGNREPVMESVPKKNLEDCYKVLDECAKQIGFELYTKSEWNKTYKKDKNTNYMYYIHFTPEMDKDQLKLDIFNKDALAEQLVWTINNAHDIRVAFNNLIIPHIEGLE